MRSAKIVEGRLQKMRDQVALTNQATLSNPDKTVAELVKETIAAVGENVKVCRCCGRQKAFLRLDCTLNSWEW